MAKKKEIEYQTVVLKNSSLPGKVPGPKDLLVGEVALSLYKGEESIWAKNSCGEVVKLNSITKDDLWSKDVSAFLTYSDYDTFIEDLNAGSISYESIVFISDDDHRGLWTQGTFYSSVDDPSEYVKIDDIATEDKNGLMSREDKIRFDEIFEGDIDVVSPVISGEWSIYNNSGAFVRTSSEKILDLEYGFKVQWEGTYTWNSDASYKIPTQVSPDSNWNVLVEEGSTSSVYQSGILEDNETIKIELQSPREGLTVDDRDVVVPATGFDSSADQVEVKFLYRLYYGTLLIDNPDENDIKHLTSILSESKEFAVENISCSETEYYCFAYPQELGELKYILQDTVTSIKGAFTLSTLQITNDSGKTVDLYVYVSNNPGAFTTTSLEFK